LFSSALDFQEWMQDGELTKTFTDPCDVCNDGTENWICLACRMPVCSRFVRGHAEEHWIDTLMMSGGEDQHSLVLSTRDLSVWCYACNCYVKHERLLPLLTRAEALKFGEPEHTERLANVRTVFNVALSVDGGPSFPDAVLGRLDAAQLAMQCVTVAAGATAESNAGNAPALLATLLGGDNSATSSSSSSSSSSGNGGALNPSHAGLDRGLVLLTLDADADAGETAGTGGRGQRSVERLVQGALAARGAGKKALLLHCDAATAALTTATVLAANPAAAAAAALPADAARLDGEATAGTVARLAAEHAPDLIVVSYAVEMNGAAGTAGVFPFAAVGTALVEGVVNPALQAAGLPSVSGGHGGHGASSASAQVPTCRVAVCVCFEHGALDAQGEESAATVVEAVAGALLR